VTVTALETEDHLFFAGVTKQGEILDDSQCRRLFNLEGKVFGEVSIPTDVMRSLDEALVRHQRSLVEDLAGRNGHWFELEMDKLDRWAEDRRTTLRSELSDLDEALKEAKKAARLAPTLPEKLECQRHARTLENKRDEAWRAFDQASRDIDQQKDALLDEISERVEQKLEQEKLFTLAWRLG
jgi:hypothetical protein